MATFLIEPILAVIFCCKSQIDTRLLRFDYCSNKPIWEIGEKQFLFFAS